MSGLGRKDVSLDCNAVRRALRARDIRDYHIFGVANVSHNALKECRCPDDTSQLSTFICFLKVSSS